MDIHLFSSVIRNLLRVDVMVWETVPDHADPRLGEFEAKYCYHKSLQPMYTAETLASLLAGAGERILYQTQDSLGSSCCFFKEDQLFFALGPYVTSPFDEARTRNALMAAHLPASYVPSIRLYYSGFPIISTGELHHAVIACLHAFTGNSNDYLISVIKNTKAATAIAPREGYQQTMDYRSVRQRYERENQFLNMIELGDTENVALAFQEMNLYGMGNARYVNATYQEPVVALAMTRALARKAAEHGGADIVEINEITQRAAQKIYDDRNVQQQIKDTWDMLEELTEAVRNHRMMLGHYSAPIRAAVTFLRHNYTQNIPMTTLCHAAGLSESALSRTFHKETGMTIPQYVAHIRCEEAARLLAQTNHSIQDISAYVGYEDSNYFVKVFKRQYGETPSAWRAAHAE